MPLHDELADEYIGHAVDLQRIDAGIRQKVAGLLQQLRDEARRLLDDADIGSDTPGAKVRRLSALFTQFNQALETSGRAQSRALRSEMRELAELEQDILTTITSDVIGANVLRTTLTKAELIRLADGALVRGGPMQSWLDKQTADTRQAFETEMRLGVGLGETNRQLADRILGKRTGDFETVEINGKMKRVPLYDGGILNIQRRQADALVRTSVQQVSNDVQWDLYSSNKDVLRGVQALVTLDGRTTPICIARSGAAWDFDGNPLPESTRDEPFPGSPPWHWNCRTVLMPITRTYDEIIEAASGKKLAAQQRRFPVRKRAALGGPVAADLNYEQWLRTKSKAFQLEVLGEDRWKLWKANKISLSQLIDQSGNPLTIKQLRVLVDRGVASAIKSVLDLDILGIDTATRV